MQTQNSPHTNTATIASPQFLHYLYGVWLGCSLLGKRRISGSTTVCYKSSLKLMQRRSVSSHELHHAKRASFTDTLCICVFLLNCFYLQRVTLTTAPSSTCPRTAISTAHSIGREEGNQDHILQWQQEEEEKEEKEVEERRRKSRDTINNKKNPKRKQWVTTTNITTAKLISSTYLLVFSLNNKNPRIRPITKRIINQKNTHTRYRVY